MHADYSQVEELRPKAVVEHVARLARRQGCNERQARDASAIARKALEAGESSHRAIMAGVRYAADVSSPAARASVDGRSGRMFAFWIVVAVVLVLAAFFWGRV